MPPSALDTTIIDYVWGIIKLVAFVSLLGAVTYIVLDVYHHVKAIDAECRAKEDMARIQARNLLDTFCTANPYDNAGLCAGAHRRLYVEDYSHAVRDCRTEQMLDHRFFSREVIVDVISQTGRGVATVCVVLLIVLYFFGKLGAVAGEALAVARNYANSKNTGLPVVVKPAGGPDKIKSS